MGILDNAKEVANVVQEIHNLPLYQRVLSLYSDIISLVEENNRLRDENKKLSETIALRKVMIFRAPFFYQDGDQTPFCPACWEGNQKAAHLMFSHEEATLTRWDCPTCKQMYLLRKNNPKSSDPHGPTGPFDSNSWMR